MLEALLAAVQSSAGEARALLLTGDGPVFCAGFDLSLCQHDETVLRTLLTGLARCISALRQQVLPVVISAHGAAVAGACALLGAGDYVVTTRDAKIGYPVVRLGISPAVSAPTLVEQVGAGAARARLLDTQLLDGSGALRAGLVQNVQESAESCKQVALQTAFALANKAPHALQATRRWCQHLAKLEDAPLQYGAEGQLLTTTASERALLASLALVQGEEEKRMLPAAWKK